MPRKEEKGKKKEPFLHDVHGYIHSPRPSHVPLSVQQREGVTQVSNSLSLSLSLFPPGPPSLEQTNLPQKRTLTFFTPHLSSSTPADVFAFPSADPSSNSPTTPNVPLVGRVCVLSCGLGRRRVSCVWHGSVFTQRTQRTQRHRSLKRRRSVGWIHTLSIFRCLTSLAFLGAMTRGPGLGPGPRAVALQFYSYVLVC
jgi:hypothetical protein